MGNSLTGKPTETRNLLAENDMYQMFEFTSLRQQVVIVREVTSERAEIVTFGRVFRESSPTTCGGETLFQITKV
jgi:hypothetical protein